jgi:hypothetical protein
VTHQKLKAISQPRLCGLFRQKLFSSTIVCKGFVHLARIECFANLITPARVIANETLEFLKSCVVVRCSVTIPSMSEVDIERDTFDLVGAAQTGNVYAISLVQHEGLLCPDLEIKHVILDACIE